MKELKAKIKTYIEQLESGNIKNNNVKVLSYLKENPTLNIRFPETDILTMKQRLRMTHQSLTAILSNLEDLGLIRVIGQHEEIHNGRVSTYSIFSYVSESYEREELIKNRRKEKYELWLKSGKNNFSDLIPSQILFYIELELTK